MVTVIARFKIQEGKQDEALEQLKKMTSAVETQEQGVLAYMCHRSQNDPLEIVFVEIYSEADVLQAHGETPHVKEFIANLGQFSDGSGASIELMEPISGFTRGKGG